MATRTRSRFTWARRALTPAVAAMALVLVVPHTAFAGVSPTPDDTAQVVGRVFAVAQVGDRTIIGGSFSSVGGEPRRNVAAILPDGTVDPAFDPSVDGTVYAVDGSADGSRVFLGGAFTNAGGEPHANLAAVDAMSGTAVPSWQADTTGAAPDVRSLAVSGDRLYVGGRFVRIDDIGRKRLAAVGTGTGDVISSFRPRPDLAVFEVAVSPDGSEVYAGGAFTTLGGQPRPFGAAGVLAANGNATAFNPSVGGGRVVTIGLSPDGSRLYVATENNSLFAYDLASNVPVWTDKTSGDTQAIAVSATEVYIGGHFSQIVSPSPKTKRSFLASLDPSTGTVTTWNPNPRGTGLGVWAIELTPTAALVGGEFDQVGGADRRGFARFSGTP